MHLDNMSGNSFYGSEALTVDCLPAEANGGPTIGADTTDGLADSGNVLIDPGFKFRRMRKPVRYQVVVLTELFSIPASP